MQAVYRYNDDIGGRRSLLDRRILPSDDYAGIERRITGDRRKGTRKREHKRFLPKESAFVKLKSETGVDVSQMTDISKKGLSFRFFIDIHKERDHTSLDIFDASNDFIVNEIPFQKVSETIYSTSAFSTAITKRCGVRFKELSSEQDAKLDYYLKNHTFGEIQ